MNNAIGHKASWVSGWVCGIGLIGAATLGGCGSGNNATNGTTSNSGPQPKPSTTLIFDTPKSGTPLAKWLPDAAYSDYLDDARPLSEGFSADEKALSKSSSALPLAYTMRLPANSTLKEVASSLVDPVFTVQPAQQGKDAETSLVVSIQTVKQGTLPTPQARLQELAKQTSSAVPLTYSHATFGTINGRPFVRVEGSTGAKGDKHQFRNFTYVTVDSAHKRTIAITGSDVEPSASRMLPRLEAAARTFR